MTKGNSKKGGARIVEELKAEKERLQKQIERK